MTSERSKRRDFLSLIFISKSISKKLLIKIIVIIIIIIINIRRLLAWTRANSFYSFVRVYMEKRCSGKEGEPHWPVIRVFNFIRRERLRGRRFSHLLSGARARTNVILAGKRDNPRHSNTSFSENIVVAKTSYQIVGILSFSDLKRAWTPSTEISVLTFVVKKKVQRRFRGVYF